MGSRIDDVAGELDELRRIRQEWLDVQSSTAPANRDEAEFGIALAYDSARLTPPHTVVWVPDPALGAVVAARLTTQGTRVSSAVWNQARQRGRSHALRIYSQRAWDQALAAVRFPERDRVEPAIRLAALGLAFTSRNSKVLVSRVEAAVVAWGQYAFWSHLNVDYRKRGLRLAIDAHGPMEDDPIDWRPRTPEYHDVEAVLDWAIGQRAHVEEFALLDALSRLNGSSVRAVEGLTLVARSAGWWWPFEGVAVVCERPTLRALDREGRLHAEDGPALVYPDGFSAYFWHGRVVPRWVVVEPSVERIAKEANVEVRRCAIESLGWSRFTAEAGLKLLDECPDPGNFGQTLSLYAVPTKVWGMPAHVLVCTNGSVDLDGGRHTFGLLVPVTVDTALGAAAWGYGLTAAEYASLERRA